MSKIEKLKARGILLMLAREKPNHGKRKKRKKKNGGDREKEAFDCPNSGRFARLVRKPEVKERTKLDSRLSDTETREFDVKIQCKVMIGRARLSRNRKKFGSLRYFSLISLNRLFTLSTGYIRFPSLVLRNSRSIMQFLFFRVLEVKGTPLRIRFFHIYACHLSFILVQAVI